MSFTVGIGNQGCWGTHNIWYFLGEKIVSTQHHFNCSCYCSKHCCYCCYCSNEKNQHFISRLHIGWGFHSNILRYCIVSDFRDCYYFRGLKVRQRCYLHHQNNQQGKQVSELISSFIKDSPYRISHLGCNHTLG